MTDERALRSQPSAGGAVSRALGWVGLTLVLFVVAQITALFVTSRVTSEIGVGFPEREHFAFAEALVGGLLMLLAVPVGGRVLGHRIGFWPGLAFVLPFLLAAVANYAFFEDIRSGHIFDTDQALFCLVTEVSRQGQQAIARDARQEAARQLRRHETRSAALVIDEKQIHAPHFLDVTPLYGVEPHHLFAAVLERFLLGH